MSPEKRSALMSRIRGKNTSPEKSIRTMLWRQGFRFRLHAKELKGKPDIILPKWRAVVFVHGCFWHGHENCRLFRLPATRTDFWKKKLTSNRDRDRQTVSKLSSQHWRVAIVWECTLRADPAALGESLATWVRSDNTSTEFSGFEGHLRLGPLPRQRQD